MGRTFKTWVYHDDQGGTYNRKAPTDFTTQMADGAPKIGGELATSVATPFPKAFRPRVALCQDEDGNKYRVVCYSADAALFLTLGTTLNIFDRDGGAAITVTSYSSEGERKRAKLLTP